MTINLQTNNSEKFAVNKRLSLVGTMTGSLRDGPSIVNPIFLIECSGIFPQANYLTVPEFGRSYFIEEIASVRTGLWQLKCHVDVLSSWKSQLLNLGAIIERNPTLYNLYLDDPEFVVTQRRYHQSFNFPNRPVSGDGLYTVLTVAGKGGLSTET